MRMTTRSIALALAFALATAVALPTSVAAQNYKEFEGRIEQISKKKMIVDNKMGDKVSFVKVDATEVAGEEKESWEDLKRKDWVRVSWIWTDKPRKAYKIKVLPPKDSAL